MMEDKDSGDESGLNAEPGASSAPSVEPKAWAFVAHKNGYWAGLASAGLKQGELRKFLGEFAADGFTITPVFDRDEYNALLDTLGYWHDRPGANTAGETA